MVVMQVMNVIKGMIGDKESVISKEDDFEVVDVRVKRKSPKCCQAKGSKDEEKLVHLKMVVKFEVLIEKKKMCSLGLMRSRRDIQDVLKQRVQRLRRDGVFDGAFGGVGDEEVVVGEGVVGLKKKHWWNSW
ncbi:hypothetical protein Tco_0873883 [Tanacetum coccineum]|uniref:Uncharacterized protein n=1 Tax=Tanacetum coccineum TaxID=301880 RepID=A0ABQ5BN09_9ASTR